MTYQAASSTEFLRGGTLTARAETVSSGRAGFGLARPACNILALPLPSRHLPIKDLSMPSKKAAQAAHECAGKLTDAQFDALLVAKSITGEALIEALRDHLVSGLSPIEAWAKHAKQHVTDDVTSERQLDPGTVDPEHFDLLLEGTLIRSPDLIVALRDYLVDGTLGPEAFTRHGVNKSQFYSSLKKIREEHERVSKLSRFYR